MFGTSVLGIIVGYCDLNLSYDYLAVLNKQSPIKKKKSYFKNTGCVLAVISLAVHVEQLQNNLLLTGLEISR